MTHANTPAIQVFDPRGLSVRSLAYHRRENASAPEPCITQQEYDRAGRAVLTRDPRLFRLHQDGQTAANQHNIFSLSGTVVLSQNSDAGWRLGLPGAHGQSVEGWDQKLSQSRVDYDPQRRPVATFERAWQGAERCIARFTYADNDADTSHNLRGQLIRHDDSAGTLLFTEFSLNATPLQQSRTFIADPQWPVDWPESVPERDALLENAPAITRLHCNAAGEPVTQTDALGNRQTFLHTCAAELREVRLKLAGPAEETALVRDIQYNAFGQIERQCAGNGVISWATYRPDDGRLEHLKAHVTGQPALQDLTYEYDAVGNITCITDGAEATHFHRNQRIEPVNRYRYDSLYRLIEASGRQLRNAPGGPQLPDFQPAADPGQLENYTRIYTYDEAGNLKVMQHQADSASRTERTAIARLSNRSLPEKPDGELPDEQEIAIGHDLNGNRTGLQPGQTLLWDLRNQLRQVDQVVREDEPDDCEFYVYDGSGQRQRKIRQAYTGTLTRTHETRYLPGVEVRTSADETLHVVTIKAGRSTVQILHWQTEPPAGIPQNQHRYGFTDHLGSSALELDEAALLISRESYYPYGGTCWWAGRNKLEANYKTLRYSGQERDATGLYYYGFRYYVPWCQRWLNPDPAGVADGLNLFAMVHGNPIGHVDFQGLITVGEVFNAAGATLARDGLSALAGGTVRYFATQALTQWATPSDDADGQAVDPGSNLALTVAGSVVGALAGGSMGMGAGSNIVSRYSNSRTAQRVGAGIGGLLGATAGAAAPLYSYLSNPGTLNVVAISVITSAPGGLTRETGQRVSAELGPRLTLAPSGVATALRTGVYGALLFSGGAIRAELSPLAGVAISAVVEGLDGASIVTINALRAGTYASGTNRLSMPNFWEVIYGWSTRTAGATLTASLTFIFNPLTSAIENVNLRMGTVATMATPTEARTYLGQHVQRGTAALFRYDDVDFTLDHFTQPNREWTGHPDMPTRNDIPMITFRPRASSLP
ncbi:RHS repeat-associated core domain-containing protein [Pseudomonas sp. GM48]|uniref:RHS repeat-associated core domain-containing protein n=1 Tax=Pseudomonas sp. GM48 TaxID=1144330 RepID=UPI00026FE675|nr:RHS repeat-associated core domain-containing protein [Pseudomonas sp. GM48]EJM54578.1 RHS repeat-associated core domain protein containing protein [Pseudomonas sp. GM48]